ncbi:prepilin-type N-terminal cleavage/methylation domain-containing protein [Candidatus Peregrinibacteria bacterium]|nr:prepilin-type N-terminal cleavage/methylation domain-containing protein [Candidatus Peregrinibacteria bacterium]
MQNQSLVTRHSSLQKGFTLAEIIIVVMILAFISTISFRTYYDLREKQDFNNALNQIVELIKTARNDAITSQAVYLETAPETPIIPSKGYGVFINLTPTETEAHLTLFANTSVQGNFADQFDEEDSILEKLSLPASITFDKLFKLSPTELRGIPDTGTDIGNQAVILFRPPVAETFLSNNGDPTIPENLIDTLSIQLFPKSQATRKKVITIDKIGGIPAIHL